MGLGKLPVHTIEQRAAESGLAAVELHAQTHACGLRATRLHRPRGPVFEDGIEHISMHKELQ
ncbi:MAG TPA: hypothetical protein VKS82_22175 [Streptosporangiaceae bacterium]|nr:hypothetical protein [Streptosporangiaceae bacterium]